MRRKLISFSNFLVIIDFIVSFTLFESVTPMLLYPMQS